ncbi:hypothetical protein SLOPH_1023 [Spraguea lophii 42_110]|uniref:Uncharacterized protein n=1 Tax=Spraguea lophii (strain 42_110) TaxID=1358809 RepID=S7W7G7_SPRLO|nr:hypothetical protein SLOPH_1023 [Spraguea lophii 42_110]
MNITIKDRIDLENKINYSNKILSFLRNMGVLKENHRYPLCIKNMKMIRNKFNYGFILIYRGKIYNKMIVSIKIDNILSRIKLPLISIIRVIYEWSPKRSLQDTMKEVGIFFNGLK